MNKDSKKELIKEAIREFKLEELKQKKSRIYHNAELLMENYNALKQHADNAIYSSNQLFREDIVRRDFTAYSSEDGNDDRDFEDLDYDELYIESILKSKVRTTIMVLHIEMALEVLRKNAKKGGYAEKFEALTELYISDKPFEEVAEKYHCDQTTIRRWKNDILRKLSILLFGEEALISLA